MSRLLDREIDMAEVEDRIVENFEKVFEYRSTTGAQAETRPVGSVSHIQVI
jgi:hypothetical protein